MTNLQAETPPLFKTLAIVGVGLIGGSIAAAVKKRGVAEHVVGVGRSASRLQDAGKAGLLDSYTTDVVEAAARADLLVFCTPVDRIVSGIRRALPGCRPGTLITDAGSVKEAICRALPESLPGDVTFIGSHPLAGSEKAGFEHADADLYEGRVCTVTPWSTESSVNVDRLEAFWRALGMRVFRMRPDGHDHALAETSHLPHLLAAALALLLTNSNRHLAASGFRDTTRIAAGDADLWVAILMENAEQVLRSLSVLTGHLDEFRTALSERNEADLRRLLQQAKENRDMLSE